MLRTALIFKCNLLAFFCEIDVPFRNDLRRAKGKDFDTNTELEYCLHTFPYTEALCIQKKSAIKSKTNIKVKITYNSN